MEILSRHEYDSRYPQRLRPSELSYGLSCRFILKTLEEENEYGLRLGARITSCSELPDGECMIIAVVEWPGGPKATEPITISREGDVLSNILESEMRGGYMLPSKDENQPSGNREAVEALEVVV